MTMRSAILTDEEYELVQHNDVVEEVKTILDNHKHTFDVKTYGTSMLACLDETALHICDLLSVYFINEPELFHKFDNNLKDNLKTYIYVHNRILRESKELVERVKNEF